MSRFPYQFFNEYVVRTPLFSCKKFQDQLGGSDISDAALKQICSDSVFLEAIYLASPALHREINKWIDSKKEFSKKEDQKLKQTILKYYSRISTRCTPFGLFSSVGLGCFDSAQHDKSIISSLQSVTNNKIRDTRLDMYFLVSLVQHFVQQPEIRNKLLFCPNNSIYKVGSRIRYIEYQDRKSVV